MISIVTWLWHDGSRDYRAEHVNAVAQMWREKCSVPHRFICIADADERFSDLVEHVPTPVEALRVGKLRTPEGPRFPSCYRRIWMFSEAARVLGDRVFLTDVDHLLTADPAPLLAYDGDFVGWHPRMIWGNQRRVGGGMYLLRTGSLAYVWENFLGEKSIREARAAGFRGSDQAWLSYMLGTGERYWPADAGIYSIRDLSNDPRQRNGAKGLPADAVLVQFNGPQKPWLSSLPWVKKHWPKVAACQMHGT